MTPPESLRDLCEQTPCVLWPGGIGSKGYGYLTLNGRQVKAHRRAWEEAHGAIPAGMWIDHMCRNRRCVNVAHLRLVTPRQNAMENNDGKGATNAAKDRCEHGHPLSGRNLITKKRKNGALRRACRECQRISSLKYVHRVRPANSRRGLDEALASLKETQ